MAQLQHGEIRRSWLCGVACAAGLTAALSISGPTLALGSEGALIEVLQPMLLPGSGEIVLHNTTYEEDSYGGAGAEMASVGRRNYVKRTLGVDNTNVAYSLGISVALAGVKEVPDSGGFRHVDTALVVINANEAVRRAHRGMDLGYGPIDAKFLERLCAATEDAVIANAERSWPPIHFVRLRTVLGGVATTKIVGIRAAPRGKLY